MFRVFLYNFIAFPLYNYYIQSEFTSPCHYMGKAKQVVPRVSIKQLPRKSPLQSHQHQEARITLASYPSNPLSPHVPQRTFARARILSNDSRHERRESRGMAPLSLSRRRLIPSVLWRQEEATAAAARRIMLASIVSQERESHTSIYAIYRCDIYSILSRLFAPGVYIGIYI